MDIKSNEPSWHNFGLRNKVRYVLPLGLEQAGLGEIFDLTPSP